MTKLEKVPERVIKATKLEVENCMRLRAATIEFDPEQNVFVVAGNNAEGKTSLLMTVAMLLGGRRLDPPRVVHDGEEEARAELTLDDGYVVRCTWKAGHAGKLEVISPDGVAIKSPQAWLTEKVGRYSFDPCAFLSLKEPDQQTEVQRTLGLDFGGLDSEHAAKFSERTVVGRERDRAVARLSALPRLVDGAPQYIDTKGLLLKQEELLAVQRERESLASAAREAATLLDASRAEYRQADAQQKQITAELLAAEATVTRLRQQVDSGKLHLKTLETRGEQMKKAEEKARAAAETAPDPEMDLMMLRAQLEEADKHTEAALKAKEREQVSAELKTKEAEYDALSKRLTAIDNEKAKLLSAAKFPVDGLSFSGTGLKLNGLPFSQASQAERLRVSVALGLISKPELRLLLVREGSLLDNKSMGLLAQVAREYDAQVIIECVGRDRKGPCIIIEDGAVVEVRR